MKHLTIILAFSILTTFVSAQTWEPTSSPTGFLTDHTFGFSLKGKGYLVAGTTEFDGPSKAFFQFDPVADTWTSLDSFPGAARGYGIGDVWDGKAYFGFGTSTTAQLKDIWVFDPDSMNWTPLDTCLCEPRLHPAFVANEGKIFVGLGNNSNGNLNDWWEYDIASGIWERKPDFPGSRRHHPYMFAIGDYIYTGFGHGQSIYKEWYRYHPASETWLQVLDLPAEGRVAGTQFSYGDRGYVLSGDGEDHSSMEEGEFWEYHPDNDDWIQLPPHPGKSRWAPASFIIDGIVYLYNGSSYFEGSDYVYHEDAYKFNVEALISSTKTTEDFTDIMLWPNPVKEEIFFDADQKEISSIQIYSLTGELVLDQLTNGRSINVSILPTGLYEVLFKIDNTYVSKLIYRN
ncbi:MAG: T9SS type A sorting domain-containing protein [Bacteroidota bacterium]|nr:T9SS type A sorting domain-containing protein [Bacteroidota bacterium]